MRCRISETSSCSHFLRPPLPHLQLFPQLTSSGPCLHTHLLLSKQACPLPSPNTLPTIAALFAAYKQRPLPAFWALVAGRAAAKNLFVKYAKAKVGVTVRCKVI